MKSYNNGHRPAEQTGYQAPAVTRAFTILRAVAGAPGQLGLSELAAELGFGKSTTHGLVHALFREGALVQGTEGKKLMLGSDRSWIWPLPDGTTPESSAGPTASSTDLRDTIDETVFLGVLNRNNARAVIMATAEALKPLEISSPPGTVHLASRRRRRKGLSGPGWTKTDGLGPDPGRGGCPGSPTSPSPGRPITWQGTGPGASTRIRPGSRGIPPGVKAVAVGLGNLQGLPLAVWVVGFAAAMARTGMPPIIEATLDTAARLKQVLDNGTGSDESDVPHRRHVADGVPAV